MGGLDVLPGMGNSVTVFGVCSAFLLLAPLIEAEKVESTPSVGDRLQKVDLEDGLDKDEVIAIAQAYWLRYQGSDGGIYRVYLLTIYQSIYKV